MKSRAMSSQDLRRCFGTLLLGLALASARKLQTAVSDVSVIESAATYAHDDGTAVGQTDPGWWGRRVEILLAVMSRCPDARAAEAVMDEVLARVHPIANIRLIYIAEVVNSTKEHTYGVICKHGDLECAGNAQQLCAQYWSRQAPAETGLDPWTRAWDFIKCQNREYEDLGKFSLANKCLEEAGFFGKRAELTQACWSGPDPVPMLRNSAREALRHKASVSATVFVNGEYRCTRDDDQWVNCPGGSEVDDFVYTVCDTYRHWGRQWPEAVCGPEPNPLPKAR